MSVYDEVRAYHEQVGDDYGREHNRFVRYDAALSLFPPLYDGLLDVGCGTGQFRVWWKESTHYTGIDLLEGQNVLDYHEPHGVILGLGIFYRVFHGEQFRLLSHLWDLAEVAVVAQTITTEHGQHPGEYPADPVQWLRFARTLTPKVALRMDYMDGRDMTIALYR